VLDTVHNTIKELLYAKGQIDPTEVEIEFNPPTKDWVNSRVAPTLNFFLYDLEENTDLRQADYDLISSKNAKGVSSSTRRVPPKRFDLHYMVSAISTVIDDEHLLLWRAMVTLLKNPTIPEQFLPENILKLELPVKGRVSQPDDGPRPMDLWSALETPPRPSLLYVLTVPVDLETGFESPLILTRTARYRLLEQESAAAEVAFHIGGVVKDRLGSPISGANVGLIGHDKLRSDSLGRFVLTHVPAGEVKLEVSLEGKKSKTVTLEIPSDNYDVTLE
jgi:Pvc16 N-terminal domain/Carboxypeptidase regulatory-like domain